KLSASARERLARGRAMHVDDYRRALERRAVLTGMFDRAAPCYDGFVALAATGAAPPGLASIGNPGTNVLPSLVGAPAISLPLLSDEDLPLGLQLVCARGNDADLMALSGWLAA